MELNAFVDEDRKDIDGSLAGDSNSYQRLICRYEKQVALQMWRFCRNPTLCEELVQEVFVQAYFSLKSYRGDAPFFHWIRKIALRVGYHYWKKKGKEEKQFSVMELDQLEYTAQSLDSSTAGTILYELLAQLCPTERLVLTLMYFEECSIKEIAERMGWNQSIVKMRAYRARKKLKKIAEREKVMERLEWTY